MFDLRAMILVAALLVVLLGPAVTAWRERRSRRGPRRNSGAWRERRRKRDWRDFNTRFYGDRHGR